MGPETTMNSQTTSTNPDSTLLAVPKLRDDGSNWSDYYPRIQNAMGAKGLWRHVLGTATAPVPYVVSKGTPMLADGKTPATEDQIEAKESKIVEFEKREYFAKHILLSTTSTRLGAKIKDQKTAEAMWKLIVDDATSKSTLHLLDAENQLSSMKLKDNDDPKTHLSELKLHFQTMQQRRENLIKIGSTMSEQRFNIIIMSSLPESYRPTLQTITASERVSRLSGTQSTAMKSDDLIDFIIEEAPHHVINDEWNKNTESALAARSKGTGKSNRKEKDKSKPDVVCDNCNKPGHTGEQCYSKGGGSEGQGPKQKARAKDKAKESETATVATNDEGDLFAFTCSSDYTAVAEKLEVPKSRLGTCIDSGASMDYCPDRARFTNYKSIQRKIMTADGRTLMAIGSGDLHIELPNGSGKTKVVFKNAIHAPEMAFTLISISRLDQAGYTVTFKKRVCTIKDPNGKTIATIPHVDGMYKIATPVSPDIDDTTRQTKLYFPEKKSKLVSSYQKDNAYINTQSESRIITGRSDRGEEFLAKRMVNHQNRTGNGYRIHWPKNKSVTVKRNVVFNPEDINSSKEPATVLGEAQSEGERYKVVQTCQKNVKPKPETSDDETSLNQGYGHGKWTRRHKRSFRNPNDGLTAAITTLNEGKTHGDVDNIVDYSPKLPPKSTIFVANIPWTTTEEDLVEIFTEYGEVSSVRLHMNSKGRPQGNCHIEFANPEIAVATVNSASREPIHMAGRDLHVDFATGIRNRIRNLSYARHRRDQSFSNSNNNYLQGSSGFSNRKHRRFIKRERWRRIMGSIRGRNTSEICSTIIIRERGWRDQKGELTHHQEHRRLF